MGPSLGELWVCGVSQVVQVVTFLRHDVDRELHHDDRELSL